MVFDKEEMEKLPPEARLKKLKELEEARKIESEVTESILKKTQEELKRQRELPAFKVPELEPVDISKMFLQEDGLEGQLNASKMDEESKGVEYVSKVDYSAQGQGRPQYDHERGGPEPRYQTVLDEMMDITASASVKALHLYRNR